VLPAIAQKRAAVIVERSAEQPVAEFRLFEGPAAWIEERPERRDERASGRIENRQERSGNRIERRDERITNRIERRDMLFSLPAEATAVTVGGTRCYKVGGLIYRPAFYQGETVYVLAPE
jgi:hypothetical protein